MKSQRKLRWHEFRVYFDNRPLPYCFLETIRHFGDVVRIPGLGVFIHDPIVAKAVFERTDVISNKEVGAIGAWVTQILGPFALINMDGKEHQELKELLKKRFTKQNLDVLTDEILLSSTLYLTAKLDRGERVDLCAYMEQLSARLICTVVGISLEGKDADAEYEDIYTSIVKLTSVGGIGKKLLNRKDIEYGTYFHKKIAAYTERAYESYEVHSKSVIALLKEEGYEYKQVEGLLTVLLIGGMELVSHAVPRVAAMLLDSGSFDDVKNDRSLLSNAINEGLRLVTPSDILFKAVTEDVIIADYAFKKNTRVYISLYGIMRSRTYVPHPKQYDIHRTIPKELKFLWFGHGAHSCLGFFLAYKELEMVLGALMNVSGELEVVDRTYVHNMSFPSYKTFILQKK